MVQKFPDIQEMTYDVTTFLWNNYQERIPDHTTQADIKALWMACDRIQMFKRMADMADTEFEYNLFTALTNDYEVMASAFLHAIDVKSDEMARHKQMAVEQRAIAGKYNIDPDAMAS